MLKNGFSTTHRKWSSEQQLHLLAMKCPLQTTPMVKMSKTIVYVAQWPKQSLKWLLHSCVAHISAMLFQGLLWSAICNNSLQSPYVHVRAQEVTHPFVYIVCPQCKQGVCLVQEVPITACTGLNMPEFTWTFKMHNLQG